MMDSIEGRADQIQIVPVTGFKNVFLCLGDGRRRTALRRNP